MLPAVLMVDDDPALLKVFCRILSSDKFELVAAGSYQEAIAAAETLGERCLMLVSDQQLGTHLGTDLATELRQKVPSLAVLILTGNSNDIKGFEVMAKPFNNDRLLQAILNTIRG